MYTTNWWIYKFITLFVAGSWFDIAKFGWILPGLNGYIRDLAGIAGCCLDIAGSWPNKAESWPKWTDKHDKMNIHVVNRCSSVSLIYQLISLVDELMNNNNWWTNEITLPRVAGFFFFFFFFFPSIKIVKDWFCKMLLGSEVFLAMFP